MSDTTAPTTTMQELARRWVYDHDEEALAEYCQREAVRLDAEETMTEPGDLADDLRSDQEGL